MATARERGLHVTALGQGEPAILVHGSFSWGLDTFPAQRELADGWRVLFVDRRGFGASPAGEVIGWPADAEDLGALLDEVGPAHLVGQSYGAVVSLLAAGERPERVRSLVVIEPPAFGLASHDPAAAEIDRALGELYAHGSELEPAEFVREWFRGLGRPVEPADAWMATFAEEQWDAAKASRRERYPGDAPIRLDAVALVDGPKVVVSGGAPSRAPGRAAYRAVCETVAEGIGGELVVFERSLHNPQVEEAERFNALLRDFWSR